MSRPSPRAGAKPGATTPSSSQPEIVAMFNDCHNLTIKGGTFNFSPTISAEPDEDFRRFRLGDINLVKQVTEKEIKETHLVQHRKRPGRVKRIQIRVGFERAHHAKIWGSDDMFTVVLHHGFSPGRSVMEAATGLRLRRCRDPRFAQLFGLTGSSRALNGEIYHDKLVPIADALATLAQGTRFTHQFSKIVLDALSYAYQISPDLGMDILGQRNSSHWLRLSTGKLCIMLGNHEPKDLKTTASSFFTWTNFNPPELAPICLLSATGFSLTDREIFKQISLDQLLKILAVQAEQTWRTVGDPGPSFTLLATFYSTCPDPSCYCSGPPILGLHSLPLGSTYEISKMYLSLNVHKEKVSGIPFNNIHPILETLEPTGTWHRIAYHTIPAAILDGGPVTLTVTLSLDSDPIRDPCIAARGLQILADMPNIQEHCHLQMKIEMQVSISSLWEPFRLAGSFMDSTAAEPLFLFILEPPRVMKPDGCFLLPPPPDCIFWSNEPNGTHPLQDLSDYILPDVQISYGAGALSWKKDHFNILDSYYEAQGAQLRTSVDLATEADIYQNLVLEKFGPEPEVRFGFRFGRFGSAFKRVQTPNRTPWRLFLLFSLVGGRVLHPACRPLPQFAPIWTDTSSAFGRIQIREKTTMGERRTEPQVQVRVFCELKPEPSVWFSPVRVRTDFPNRTWPALGYSGIMENEDAVQAENDVPWCSKCFERGCPSQQLRYFQNLLLPLTWAVKIRKSRVLPWDW
ncbi:hypothetical protein GGX14DRAFT_389177 [Mycena pura]|uniref:Uncharacterized protein n=1 Tax=Mycena pura TaxID=153505 RepID=A0AAD6YKK8_9AGAR|nr:hypothetical protein GGX14DRAFT_389177 [Mycena pura]